MSQTSQTLRKPALLLALIANFNKDSKIGSNWPKIESQLDTMFQDIQYCSKYLGTILCYAIKFDCPQAVGKIFDYFHENIGDEQQQQQSIVNFVDERLQSPLQLAINRLCSRNNNLEQDTKLVKQLLSFESNVWQQNPINQKIPIQSILNKLINQNHNLSQDNQKVLIKITQCLFEKMIKFNDDESLIKENFHKLNIVSSLIDIGNIDLLKYVYDQNELIDYRYQNHFDYLQYSLQSMADEKIVNYFIEKLYQIKKSNEINVLAEYRSPVDLTLEYGNLRAMLKTIELGFSCSESILDNGCHLLRRTMIPESNSKLYPIALKCFQYLLDRLISPVEDKDLKDPHLDRIQQFVEYRFSFKVQFQPLSSILSASSSSNYHSQIVNGNFLTYALLNHCSEQASILAYQFPIRFPLQNSELRWYRFSGGDLPLLHRLIQDHRLWFHFDYHHPEKFIQYFKINCFPLYHSNLLEELREDQRRNELRNRPRVSSHEEDSKKEDSIKHKFLDDKLKFKQFIEFLEFQDLYSNPKKLSKIVRDSIWNTFFNLYPDFEDSKRSNIQEYCKHFQKRQFFKQYLGPALFESIFL